MAFMIEQGTGVYALLFYKISGFLKVNAPGVEMVKPIEKFNQ